MGYWKLDEGSGSTVKDSSGFGNDGTTIGGAQWTAAVAAAIKFQNPFAVDLDMTRLQFAVVPNGKSLNPTTGVSVCAWVNARSWSLDTTVVVPEAFRHILQKGYNTQYRLLQETHELSWYISIAGRERSVSVSIVPSTGQWHHIAGTYDGAASRLYLDGQPIGGVGGLSGAVDVSPDDLAIGCKPDSYGPFDGAIDDVRIYDRGLDSAEVAALYAGQ